MPHPNALPNSLPSSSAREAVADALYRAVNGLDYGDSALFDSSLTADATFDLNGKVMEGLAAIHSDCYDFVSTLDTTHVLANMRVSIEGGNDARTAKATCTANAQHYRPGQGCEPGAPHLLAGSLYSLDFVRDDADGLWKIKHWGMKIVWFDGDMSIVTPP